MVEKGKFVETSHTKQLNFPSFEDSKLRKIVERGDASNSKFESRLAVKPSTEILKPFC